MADPIRCIYAMEDGYFCTKHSNAFYDASCRLLDGESCEDQKPSMPITNADRIRGMTDEELAEWFIKIQDDVADYYDGGHAVAPELPTMKNSWLDWLKQEASVALQRL